MSNQSKFSTIGSLYFIYFLYIILSSCSSPRLTSTYTESLPIESHFKKINFNLNDIDENGMIGPLDGKREMAYEFCIPNNKAKRKQVSSIDKSVQFYIGPSGRIGCEDNQYLCIGSGGKRETILKLASLDYIKKIDPFYGE